MDESFPDDVTQDLSSDSLPGDSKQESLPKMIGRYRVEAILGQGGFGRVYLAHDDQLDRPVAIKIPHSDLIASYEDAKLYLTEARTVASLDHPSIVPVHDVGSSDEFPFFIVSKYVEGLDLARSLKESRPSNLRSAEIVATIAEALHSAHRQGLVHRDIKPGNILIDKRGRPFVVDFGLALREEDIGKGPKYIGTPAYMSPEQARFEGHRVDGRSDIFSLGVIFYLLLTGKRPFRGGTAEELLEQITTYEPRPPRQYDDNIPKELERICVKAISKRASDRYSTAKDLAEDLRIYLAEHGSDSDSGSAEPPLSAVSPQTSTKTASTQLESAASIETSAGPPIRIVPKGLRSFDAHDADFFLELLPGARDRNGLPDSLRFWKTRVEETDHDCTFPVGLIYGPSGCGKSSLIKAGLLPLLSQHVIPVYIEATTDDTENRLLRGLQKACPQLDAKLDLKQALAALRQGQGVEAGAKLLIVIDQFEQWLHANKKMGSTDLVRALRQCDGGRVQCIVMVRDDFWLAVSRFLRALEVKLVEGENSGLADLFDLHHAKKVLAAFGRAFGRLPENPQETTKAQRQFLQQSVEGLAEEGKIICVRLSLFAEMMKGKSWTPATLNEVGGTQGVGVTFLEESFSASTASPEHRYHQRAARAVLQELLPESGSDIKGEMKSYDQLLQVSGYGDRPDDFDDLMRILDSEIRLITPTDPEAVANEADTPSAAASESRPGLKYYQLTHDYLVSALREWLTKKQRETRRGRAELRLAEQASLWNAKPENRRLPSFWEYANIRLLTRPKQWTQAQQKMMTSAGRAYGLRFVGGLVAVLLVGLALQQFVAGVQRRNLRERLDTSVAAVSTSTGKLLPRAVEDLTEFPAEMVVAELAKRFDESAESRKLPLAFALAHYGDVRTDFLVVQIANHPPEEADNFVEALANNPTQAVATLEKAAQAAKADEQWRSRARLALVALRLDAMELPEEVAAVGADPIQRAMLIEECASWHGDLTALAERIRDNKNAAVRTAFALAVGGIPIGDVKPTEVEVWRKLWTQWLQQEPDKLTHSTAGWCLRSWNCPAPDPQQLSPPESAEWQLNSLGMTMLSIPPGQFVRRTSNLDPREQTVKLTRPFAISDREVSRRQFATFTDDASCPPNDRPRNWTVVDIEFSPTPDHPVLAVNWYDAILFCNWLSRKENLPPCYRRTGEQQNLPSGRQDVWELDLDAKGYRLPTEAEWEYACRGGSQTTFCYGDAESLLNRYAVFATTRTMPPGSKLPNNWGLFDMHGNVHEWCQDIWTGDLGAPLVTDPVISDTGESELPMRILRGSSFHFGALYTPSAKRSLGEPGRRGTYNGLGLRVARTR